MTQKEFIEKWKKRDLLVVAGVSEATDEYYVMLDEDTPRETRQEFWRDYWEYWNGQQQTP